MPRNVFFVPVPRTNRVAFNEYGDTDRWPDYVAWFEQANERDRRPDAERDQGLSMEELFDKYQSKKAGNFRWQRAKGDPTDWVTVWYDGKVSKTLVGLTDQNIYIRGHGMAGKTTIEIGRNGTYLSAADVAKRLGESGLRSSFAGNIKCYNCHSAEQGVLAEDAFAQAFTNYMYSMGYTDCFYFGYIGRLDSYPKEGSQGLDTYVRDYAKNEDGSDVLVEVRRASECRRPIFPSGGLKPTMFQRICNAIADASLELFEPFLD